MDIDHAAVDHVLATTRAVRRRLDFDRPVDNQLLLDCIDLAEQAPTGGNLGSRRWIIARDQAVKTQLGELYRQAAVSFMAPKAQSGPSETLRFEDGVGAVAEVDIAASRADVWALVTDIDLPARFSSEFLGATWASEQRGVGAVFNGRNQHPAIGEWTVPCYVDAWDERRSFGWRTSDPDNPGARWRFDLEAVGDRTRLRFSYVIGPGRSGTSAAIVANPDKEARVLRRRLNEVHANMTATVDGIKALAESAG